MALRFTIPGPPLGKPAVERDQLGRRYTSREVKALYRTIYARAARAAGLKGQRGWPMAAPIVTIIAVKRRPQARPRDYPLPWRPERNPCLAKPDADNIAKGILDGLTQAGVFRDDQRVSMLKIHTLYAACGEEPHTLVMVADLAQLGISKEDYHA